MVDRVLSIDPSGTGTTGIYYCDGKKEEFQQFTNSNWKEHYCFIQGLVKERKIQRVIFENTNFINNRSKDSLNLIRLLGAIECLSVKQVESMNVIKVKEMSKNLFSGKVKIEGLEYLPGRGKGWLWKGKKISIHCLEAFLVYYPFSNKS